MLHTFVSILHLEKVDGVLNGNNDKDHDGDCYYFILGERGEI